MEPWISILRGVAALAFAAVLLVLARARFGREDADATDVGLD